MINGLRILLAAALVCAAIALVIAFPWLLVLPLIAAFGNSPPWFRS